MDNENILKKDLERLKRENESLKSELNSVKAAFKNLENRYESFINNSIASINVLDKEGRYIVVNNRAAAFMGGTVKSILGKTLHDLMSKTDADFFLKRNKEFIEQNKVETYEREFTIDGVTKTFTILDQVVKDSFGKSVALQSMAIDITESLRTLERKKEELALSNEKFKHLAENSTTIIYKISLHPKLHFEYVNPVVEHITGYTQEEHYADPDLGSKLVHPEDRYLLEEAMLKTKGEPVAMRWITKSGKTIWTEQRNITVFDENNQPIAIEGSAREITEIKEHEAKLEKQNEELKIATKKAKEANKLKIEFLHNMSHEIRTPLNGIVGFSDLLSESNLTPEKRIYYTEIVQKSSKQLVNIIDDILELSRLETNQVQINPETFELNSLLKEIYSVFNLQQNANNIDFTLSLEFPEKEISISTDKTKLSSIIHNLVGNAFKFTTEGFVKLGYTIHNDKINISISDSGIGIAKESLKSIFGRFEQEEKEISQKAGGLGLGLPISLGNAKLLGGDITVESEKSKGSTFIVTLPYSTKSTIKKGAEISSEFSNPKQEFVILVAEDEEVNYLYIEALFAVNYKIKLLHALNGQIAVNIFQETPNIDLVLMDLKMPVMNGYEATKKIKLINPKTPVIALTAYSTPEDKQKALDNGCDEFLSKPFKKEDFIKLTNKYIS